MGDSKHIEMNATKLPHRVSRRDVLHDATPAIHLSISLSWDSVSQIVSNRPEWRVLNRVYRVWTGTCAGVDASAESFQEIKHGNKQTVAMSIKSNNTLT